MAKVSVCKYILSAFLLLIFGDNGPSGIGNIGADNVLLRFKTETLFLRRNSVVCYVICHI